MPNTSPRHPRRTHRRSPAKRGLQPGILGLTVAAALALALPADAQAPAPGAGNDSPPVLLSADQLTYDEQQELVTARGNVELSQGGRTVNADTMTYNKSTGVVTASGRVRVVEPSGDILFADYAELTDDMRDAFVRNIRVLMTDNARMAGNEGERRGGDIMRVNRAVYSPCELCAEDPTRPPLWQIRAVRVVHDKEAQEIRYKDATLEMFGLPVAYTPYMSQPDPTVDRKTGFLTPSYGNKSTLGVFVRTPYYIDVAPDQDVTLEPGFYGNAGPFLGAQYRKRFEKGILQLDGSIADGSIPKQPDPAVNSRDTLRGHVFARGLFEIDETWRWGFNLRRASEYSYLRRYYGVREDVLTSRAFVEGFSGRNYAAVNGYSFQDLRYGYARQPAVLPMAQYNALGEPGSLLGGRWALDTNILSVMRRDGTSTRRFMVQPGWQREMVSSLGFVTTLSARVLMAAYSATDYQPAGTTSPQDVSRGRFFPQADIKVRYPFVRYAEGYSHLIEPVVSLTTAPRVGYNASVPNEDSQDYELDDTNLFTLNRFSGIDRLEGGTRVTYGLRTALFFDKGGWGSLFAGQSYRFTRDEDYPAGSGLNNRQSDYVGRLDLAPVSWFDVNYGLRIDQETLKPRRHGVTAALGPAQLRLFGSYTYVDQTVDRYAVSRNVVEQGGAGVAARLSPRWSVSFSHQQAMKPVPGPRTSAATLTYEDECFTFQTIAMRDFTTAVGDEVEGNTIYFRLVFKNLGEFNSPNFGSAIFGSTSTTTN